ncbi:MAG: potassium-transporting ATPase subunit KdpA [Acidithiobacillus sp.]|nr:MULTISPECIES: potassium-transporting ATPase subunit KdpA [Acidithiobacillus]MBU2762102.1 potassium-transporting ATPase subunit KdpA [Acidithiobacillus caldus]MBU2783161.1 potassium-transporting ATPase subunit KdpA [Acidithiobacillus caldus]MCE5419597.1 potassium-transporting ATPase subunit KdpA [Acidithiobacillus sp.]
MNDALLLTFTTIALSIVLAWPLGIYMRRIYSDEHCLAKRLLGPVERAIYAVAGIDAKADMGWKQYALLWILFNVVGGVFLYVLLYLQNYLPLDPMHFGSPGVQINFNTAASFVSNTNWQDYGGETTMSYLSQMLGMAVQNFLSAASGIVLAIAMIRGFTRAEKPGIGNLWVDLVRTTLYVLIPLSIVLALFFVEQGAIQNFAAYVHADLLQPFVHQGKLMTQQVIAMGPVASQEAIKLLGTNGGGFFNANSGHPFENPTGLTNLFQMVAIFLIPFALVFYFGHRVKNLRLGVGILAVMLLLFTPLALLSQQQDLAGNPLLTAVGVDQNNTPALAGGGNMEGVEERIGTAGSALFGAVATGTSTGAANSAYDSFMPLSGMVNLLLMQLGEVTPGGVGTGIASMLAFVLIAVFLAGLMIGRTPEFLGKKIEAYEIKMASLAILVMPLLVLIGTAVAVSLPGGRDAVLNPGAHGFSEILYAVTSPSNNNGSAFGGLNANTTFYNLLTGLCILLNRYLAYLPLLAIAGSLAAKKRIPASPGTLNPATPLFVVFTTIVVLLVGALNFIPALGLGPIAEQLSLPSAVHTASTGH